MKKFLPLALLLSVLAACSSTLAVDTFPTAPDTSINCKALLADLPSTVADQKNVVVKDEIAAAWGDDDPIILRCGVEQPAKLGVASRCDMVADVGWFTEKIADGYLFTTIGRQFFVSVEVPDDYAPEADALVDLSASIEKHDPDVKPCV